MIRILVFAGLLLLVALPACGGGTTTVDAPGTEVPDPEPEPAPEPEPEPEPEPQLFPGFVDVSAAAGLTAAHAAVTDYFVTGQAWGDYDRDGWLDLYVTSSAGDNVLYRSVGDGTFEVSTLAPQVALSTAKSGGAVFVDYDNDGWRDLYVLNSGANTLFRNVGGTGFADVTSAAGVGDTGKGETAAWGDYDSDGWLDLYVTNWGPEAFVSGLDNQFLLAADRLYHNEGDGTFTDVSALLGEVERSGLGFVASFLDYDDDGDLDLYLVNDKGTPGDPRPEGPMNRDVLWRNDGDGPGGWIFTERAIDAGADARMSGMGLAIGDYDNDLDLDMYVSNAGPMVLYDNLGDGTFLDRAPEAGVTAPGTGWGTVFGDFDLDGWLDLFLSRSEAQCALLLNASDGTFDDISADGLPAETLDSYGVALADYDRDGWLDLVVGMYDEGYRLYRNRGSETGQAHGWLSVRLTGGGPVNRDAVGARVTVTRSDGLVLVQEVVCGASLGAGSDLALHFGLGTTEVTQVHVRWPDGTEDTLTDVSKNAELALEY